MYRSIALLPLPHLGGFPKIAHSTFQPSVSTEGCFTLTTPNPESRTTLRPSTKSIGLRMRQTVLMHPLVSILALSEALPPSHWPNNDNRCLTDVQAPPEASFRPWAAALGFLWSRLEVS